jgi:hypothetical protein
MDDYFGGSGPVVVKARRGPKPKSTQKKPRRGDDDDGDDDDDDDDDGNHEALSGYLRACSPGASRAPPFSARHSRPGVLA